MANSSFGMLLPEDVIFGILLSLPVISLLRFKSVCKSWRSLIESNTFINQHLHHHHHHHDDNSLIFMNPVHLFEDSRYFLNFSLLWGDKFEVCRYLDLPDCFKEGYLSYSDGKDIQWAKMVASFNGIICLHHNSYNYSGDVSLWNPATRRFRVLPRSTMAPQFDECTIFSHGFGYDVKNNDYKVVRITFPKTQIEVYSLRNDSWRVIDTVLPVNFLSSHPKTPYRDDIYCWLARLDSEEPGPFKVLQYSLLSFNFTNEVFENMVISNPEITKSDYIPQLAILRDKLARINFVKHSSEEFCYHFRVWVLNEYGVKESWTELCRIGPFPLAPRPMGFSKKGEFFLFVNRDQICMYDLVTQEMKCLPVQEPLASTYKVHVAFFKESLVSID